MEDRELKPKAGLTREKVVDRVIMFASAAVALLYLYTCKEGQLPPFQQRGILLAFCLIVIFIKYPMIRVKGPRPYWMIAIDAALSIVTFLGVYRVCWIEARLLPGSYTMPGGLDYALGTALVVAIIEGSRRVIGVVLPALALGFCLYALYGHVLPGMLWHSPTDFNFVIYYLVMGTDGVFGLPLYVASSIVIAFVIFAALLRKMGLMKFFVDFSSGLMGKYRGGPAKIAVVASAFMAMMSGSAVANVVGTGSFTIPLMKSIGYRPNFAGAVEACASTGGVTTPPVMGAAAFIIAEALGVSYWAVCVAAVLPSVLYYWGVYVGVDMEAMKLQLRGLPKERLPSVRQALLDRGYMLLPVLVLVYYLAVVKASAMLAGFWGVVAILVAGLVRRETRRNVLGLGLVEGLADGIKDCLIVATSCACAGIVVGVLVCSGLGPRISTMLIAASGGNLLVLLMLCTIACIILGMGIPVTPVYILTAMLVAPAIVKLGVMPLAAHLFVFYMANLSNITPPVCIAVFAACGISGGSIMPTGWQSCKLGAVLFILPFFFAYQQSLIWQGSPADIAVATATALIGVAALAFAFANHTWWGKMGVLSRILLGVGGVALIHPAWTVSLAGIALVGIAALLLIWQRRRVVPALARGQEVHRRR